MRSAATILLLSALWLGGASARGFAQSREEEIVDSATQTLREILAIPGKGIPESLLKEAQGIAIIPGMVKGGFVIGVKHGEGVVLTRDDKGLWQAPQFVTANGGSIGWQAGLQSTDVVLVFRSRTSVTGMMRGKFTIGADASVAAGPVGREAAAATDASLRAEILSYSRSRGLFAGLAIDGAVLQIDQRGGAAYYAPRPGQPMGTIPVSALKLLGEVDAVTGTGGNRPAPAVVVMPPVMGAPPGGMPEREAIRRQLADSSMRLFAVVDPQWKQYLSLPGGVYTEGAGVAPEQIKESLDRYTVLVADPKYRALTERREFQETQQSLARWLSAAPSPAVVPLPAPPR